MLSLGRPTWADAAPGQAKAPTDRFYGFVNIGTYDSEENMGLLGGSSLDSQLAGGFGHRLGRYFSGEAELGVMGREHDVPAGLFPEDDEVTLSIAWLSYSIVARFPIGRFALFVAAGIGSGQADLDIPDEDQPAPPLRMIADDSGVLFHYRVGFEARLGKPHRVGLELRTIDFDADLGEFTGGETDIGGTGLLFTYRYSF